MIRIEIETGELESGLIAHLSTPTDPSVSPNEDQHSK